MAFPGNVYTFSRALTNPTAVTQLQIATAAGKPIQILRAWFSANNAAAPASAGVAIQLNRKSAAATVVAAVAADIVKTNPSDGASTVQLGTALTGYTASAEGTDTDLLYRDAFNDLNGWLYLPIPEERITVTGGGFVGMKLLLAPPAGTYYAGVTFVEIG
jgi:hypothetical protein